MQHNSIQISLINPRALAMRKLQTKTLNKFLNKWIWTLEVNTAYLKQHSQLHFLYIANSGIDWCGLWSKISTHVRESKTVLDCGFHWQWIPDSRYSVPVFVSRTWIPISIVSGIPDSLSCIPDSKVQHFGFHKQNFPGFRSPQAPYVGRKIASGKSKKGVVLICVLIQFYP